MAQTTPTAPPVSSTTPPDPDRALPPHARLWSLATISAVARCLQVIAQHHVADAVPRDGASVADVARQLGLDPDALGRVLRAVAAYGVFHVELPHVRHTEASLLLRADHPMSMGAFAEVMGLPMCWDALGALSSTLATGRAGVFDLHPDGLFAYLRQHPEQATVFDRAMTAKSLADIPYVLDAYDFTRHRAVVDVGGGRGHLLSGLMDRHPHIEATLVDLPQVIDPLAVEPIGESLHLVAADFFTDALPAADLYVLMEIIHDWNDTDSVRILSNIWRSSPDEAVVLIVEAVLVDDLERPATTLDIIMLAATGGRERTPDEFSRLLDRSGFEFVQVLSTRGGVRIVEARKLAGAPHDEGC
jgi:hypothetical protein